MEGCLRFLLCPVCVCKKCLCGVVKKCDFNQIPRTVQCILACIVPSLLKTLQVFRKLILDRLLSTGPPSTKHPANQRNLQFDRLRFQILSLSNKMTGILGKMHIQIHGSISKNGDSGSIQI